MLIFSKRSILSFIGLAAAVIITSWYSIKSSEEGMIPQPTGVVENGIANHVHLQQYDLKGILAYEGNAETAIQYSDQTVRLQKVIGTYYTTPPQPNWHGKADQAHINADDSLITLTGNVELSRPAAKSYPSLQMTTSKLLLYPNSHSAYTMAPVTLSEPGTQNITHAVGLQATETPETLTLLSKVDSTYEPTNRHAAVLMPQRSSS